VAGKLTAIAANGSIYGFALGGSEYPDLLISFGH